MDNVDLCVCCGSVIPEGSMVCLDCTRKQESASTTDVIKFVEELYGMKLLWYQKLLLKALALFNPERVYIDIFEQKEVLNGYSRDEN